MCTHGAFTRSYQHVDPLDGLQLSEFFLDGGGPLWMKQFSARYKVRNSVSSETESIRTKKPSSLILRPPRESFLSWVKYLKSGNSALAPSFPRGLSERYKL